MKNIRFGTKLISGFLCVAVILLFVGLLGYYSLGSSVKDMVRIIESSPLIEGAMEMKLSLESMMNSLDEYKGAPSATEREEIAENFNKFAESYNLYGNAIINGGETGEGKFIAAKSENLRKVAEKANKDFVDKFRPAADKLMETKEKYEKSVIQSARTMEVFDTLGDKIIASANEVESQVLADIETKKLNGSDLLTLLNDVVPHVNAAMKIKLSIITGQKLIEEAIKSETVSELVIFNEKLDTSFKQAVNYIDGILYGTETDDGYINPTSNSKIRSQVEVFEKILANFQKSSSEIIELKKNEIIDSKNLETLEEDADASGEELKELLGSIEGLARKEVSSVLTSGMSNSSISKTMLLLGIGIGFIAAIFLGFFITRSVTKPINIIIEGLTSGSEQVVAATNQVSSGSQMMAEGSSEQAVSLEETSSSLEEISSMTRQNAENASHADSLMKEANQVVEEANLSMGDLTTSMDDISKASGETSKIIKTIDEIAFQTNLLALNAAVEAARAGEAGAGFAVVADEVRNLAMRASGAAKDTSDLIEGTVKKINGGSELVSTTSIAFSAVAESSGKVGELVSEIATASTEQSNGIEQVNKAVNEMDKIVQQNAANAEKNASASEKMSTQAVALMGYADDLVAMVGKSSNKENARISFDSEVSNDEPIAVESRRNNLQLPVAREVKPHDMIDMDLIDTDNNEFTDF